MRTHWEKLGQTHPNAAVERISPLLSPSRELICSPLLVRLVPCPGMIYKGRGAHLLIKNRIRGVRSGWGLTGLELGRVG